MFIFHKDDKGKKPAGLAASPLEDARPASTVLDLGKAYGQVLNLGKGETLNLGKGSDNGRQYTLGATWKEKDYDVQAAVRYADGHVEYVSVAGTVHDSRFQLRTRDGAVEHKTGDLATSNSGDEDPMEIIHVTLNDEIAAIAMVVYSARNSGVGSFHRYGVTSFLFEDHHMGIPEGGVSGVVIRPKDASHDEHVYSFVPVVIHNSPEGARVEAVELYSKSGSEHRPDFVGGKIVMDEGPENGMKPEPQG